MPSWIKEHDGLEWYDESYTMKQTNQKPAQLHNKVKSGKLRALSNAAGAPEWYAKPDVEQLREAFLKRSKAAKAWKPSDQQLEARHTRQWQKELAKDKKAHRNNYGLTGSLGPGHIGATAAHQERAMVWQIEQDAKKKKGD